MRTLRKNDYDEKDIEDLLKQMPKVKDQRGKREIYQNVTIKMNRRKRQTWLIPTAAAAAALLLMVILIPGMMGGQESAENSSSGTEESANYSIAAKESAEPSSENSQEETESTYEDSVAMDSSERQNENNHNQYESSNSESDIDKQDDYTTAVYEEDLQDRELLTYPILDNIAQNIVTVSVLVSKEEGKTKFDLYADTMPLLTEEHWGLSDNYPLDANFNYDTEHNTLNVDMFTDHGYSYGTPNIQFINSVLSTIWTNFDFDEITLSTGGEPGVHFEHNDPISQFIPEDSTFHPGYYLYYPEASTEQPFMVPYNFEQETIQDVFNVMQQDVDTHQLKASIPEDIEFKTTIDENTVVITFSDESEIENNEETAYMIEALLLTAKEFNYDAIKMENADVDMVGRFNLTQELEPPIAPNQKELH